LDDLKGPELVKKTPDRTLELLQFQSISASYRSLVETGIRSVEPMSWGNILTARDPGLDRAIEAAGGVRALARQLGISQPAISSWKRVPSDRVIAVETATGVPRRDLRPDLYDQSPALADDKAAVMDVAPEDIARADEYALLGALLWRAPTAEVLAQVARFRGDGSELGTAHLMLAEAAANADPAAIQREFFDLFVGVGRGELLPYASFYRTGFLHERPLAEVRRDMEALGLAREERIGEPEDHVAMLFDVMRGLIMGEFASDQIDDRVFYERHIKPWASRLFVDLEMTQTSAFYRTVGAVGRVFLDIEAGAMALAA
jgi:TorA maturation chaperone TorD